MNTYFGRINYENFERALVFNGNNYDFVLEIEPEQVIIKDALDRYIPMTHLHAYELYKALESYIPLIKDIAKGEEALDLLDLIQDNAIN